MTQNFQNESNIYYDAGLAGLDDTPQYERNPRNDLLAMLSLRRPAFSRTEVRFNNRWLMTLPGARQDRHGNIHVLVPMPDGAASRVLWSSHTDTAHRRDGIQAIKVDGDIVRCKGKSNCLGADCTTGVWIMREMILGSVPGMYVFHAAEECGGVGSAALAEETELFAGIDYAIAFDRYGTDEVITHQAGGRCASDAFARSMAKQLPTYKGRNYFPSSHGLFTDTANYTSVIGECTNISVGYDGHHTKREWQDTKFAMLLRDHMLAFDETKLEKSRQPGDWEPNTWESRSMYGGWSDMGDELPWKSSREFTRSTYTSLTRNDNGVYTPKRHISALEDKIRLERDNLATSTVARSLSEFVKLYPEEVADYLEGLGVDIEELYSHAPWLS